ncbi:MAG: glucokinase [Spirochaetes bacterium]|nr:MAG: glucokinase [Spirochaetota bacterium]
MTMRWLSSDLDQDSILLAGDVGGTNTNLALVGEKRGRYTLIAKMQRPSAEVTDILEPVFHLLYSVAERYPHLKPQACCISAAGPVEHNRCRMTNCRWDVDGNRVQSETGIETVVINDFLAISHAVPHLDVEDAEKIVKVPHPDGSLPPESGGVKLVIGPGTGLGVGFLVPVNGSYIPFPSEGGHSDFAPYDSHTRDLCEFVRGSMPVKSGVEPFVSGQGIVNIYRFLRQRGPVETDDILRMVDAAPDTQKPALIERYRMENEICRETVTLFLGMLGNFTGSLCAVFLPMGGVYIAGGMVARNGNLILENEVFMKHFSRNYRASIEGILNKIPVYLIRDYSISLYGAAGAAVRLIRDKQFQGIGSV